jgi:hypothetical protein
MKMRVQVVFALAFSLIADFTVAKNCKYSGWQKKMVCDDEPAGTKGKAYLATPGSSKSGKGGDGGSVSLKKAMGKSSSGSGGGFGGKKDKGHHQRTARTDEMRLEVYDFPSRPPRTSRSTQ